MSQLSDHEAIANSRLATALDYLEGTSPANDSNPAGGQINALVALGHAVLELVTELKAIRQTLEPKDDPWR